MALRHVLSIDDLKDSDLDLLSQKALAFNPAAQAPLNPLAKAPVALIFLEPSTRTRMSFERAAQITSRRHVFMEAKGSSVEKGESLVDTLKNLNALGLKFFVIRTPHTGSLAELKKLEFARVINAGDGVGEHPTQALLDLCTLLEQRNGRLGSLKGFRLGILGDLKRSRVAKSWSLLAARLGMELTLVSPASWKPVDWPGASSLAWSDDKKGALTDLDALIVLRVQKERMLTLDPEELSDFTQRFQLIPTDLTDKQLLLHPGPVNWGVELHEAWSHDRRSLILHQVAMGLRLRASLLEHMDESTGGL